MNSQTEINESWEAEKGRVSCLIPRQHQSARVSIGGNSGRTPSLNLTALGL